MNVPFNFQATAAGLKELGSATADVGAYQAGAVVVMRDWAKANGDALVRYIAAVVEGRRWLLDRANKAEAVQLLVDKAKLPPTVAARTYEVVTDPAEGFKGRQVRYGRVQKRSQAARRDRRPMGRQPARA
jgi:ABC-type nitrate/sulfonate/bicarbonate transport system substrate-binding protein